METRASKQASDAETPLPALSPSENLFQKSFGPFSSTKIEVSTPPIKSEFPQLMLSAEEFSVVMAMRSPSTSEPTSVPSLPSNPQDLKTLSKVSFEKLEAPTPPNSNPPTAATATSTLSTPKTDKKAVQKQTGK